MKNNETYVLKSGDKLYPIPGRKFSSGVRLSEVDYFIFESSTYYPSQCYMKGIVFRKDGKYIAEWVYADAFSLSAPVSDDYNIF